MGLRVENITTGEVTELGGDPPGSETVIRVTIRVRGARVRVAVEDDSPAPASEPIAQKVVRTYP